MAAMNMTKTRVSSSAMRFCRERGLVDKSASTPTHLLMDGSMGGKVNTDRGAPYLGYDTVEAMFLELVAHDLCKGAQLFVLECPGRYFRMFFDLDLTTATDAPVTRAAILAFARAMQTCAGRFYAGLTPAEQTLVVCSAPLKVDGRGGWKQGFHVYFTRLVVSIEIALLLHEAVLCEMERAHDESGVYTDTFAAMLDAAPYGKSLRMQGSDKYDHKQKRGEERVYTPFVVVLAGGVPSDEALSSIQGVVGGQAGVDGANLAKMRRLLANASVRTSLPPTPGFRPYNGHPTPRGASIGRVGGAAYDGVAVEGSAETEAIANAVRSGFGATYAKTKLHTFEVRRTPYGRRYTVKAAGSSPNGRFCHNLNGRSHASSNVYFVLTRGALQQRCFCSKLDTDGRVSGKACADWSRGGGQQSAVRLSDADAATLFG